MTTAPWSTLQLAEFLEVFEQLETVETERRAVDRVAEALQSEVAALLVEGDVRRCLGFASGAADEQMLDELAAQRRGLVHLPGLGPMHRLSVPLGSIDGALVVLRSGEPFDREEETLVRSMGRALGLALAAARSHESTRRLADQLAERHQLHQQLFRIQQSISHRAPLQEVLDAITQGASELLDAVVAGLRVRAPGERGATLASLRGYGEDMVEAFARLPLDRGFAGRAFVEEGLVVSDDYDEEVDRLSRNQRHKLGAAMAAPVFHDGETVGVLNVARSGPSPFNAAEQEILLGLAEHAALAVNDAQAVHDLRESLAGATHRAQHDELTGLANRPRAIDVLDSELRRSSDTFPVSVLFVDLDRFKTLNDMFGHAFGDHVLVEVGRRLRGLTRGADTAARLAGDEFVLILPGVGGDGAAETAHRLLRELRTPMRIAGRDVEVSVSIGVAEASAPVAADALLADADVAMYRAKEAGRDGVVRFDREMRLELFNRADLQRELATALRDGRIVAHYQPTVDLLDGRIIGFEALARWDHQVRGTLLPDEFIEIAEDSGLIVELDRAVLRDACSHLRAWQMVDPSLVMSVNLSAQQFRDPALVQVVTDALDEHGIDPSALWIEITERVVLDDDESTAATMRALRRRGVRFMVDDFGTGYSSLVYLKRFPVDALKVDRDFVDGLGTDREDEAIVTAIVRLAEALGHQVVAEGVESTAQVDWLVGLGCRQAQGFLYSPPVDAGRVDRLFAEGAVLRPLAGTHAELSV